MERANERPRRTLSKEKQDKNLNLVDVYDIAADIGKVGESVKKKQSHSKLFIFRSLRS